MITRYNIALKVLMLLSLVTLAACNEAIPRRTTISPAGQLRDGTDPCPEGQHEEKKKDEATADPDDEISVCVDDPVVRPTNAMQFKSDFCGCKDGKAVTYGNCATFCSSRNTAGAETLFANFSVTEDIALNSGLGSVYGWCNKLLPQDTVNPKCQIEAKAEDGSVIMLDATAPVDTNSITANLANLPQDQTFVLTLVETVSKARSNSVQIVKFSSSASLPVLGPLKNAPISQYSCVVRNVGAISNSFVSMTRLHFYFLPRIPPTPVPAGTPQLLCHNPYFNGQGMNDDITFPRLELIPGVFNLWDSSDPRFFDNDNPGNTIMDVNDIIVQKTRNFGGTIPSNTNLFQPFQWPGAPVLNGEAGNNTSTQPIGFYMAPWIDQATFKSYCLNSTHYNSNNALYKALRDVIGVDTEGLYVGEKTAEAVVGADGQTTSGNKDYILIRETDLKQVWFYLNNGVPTAPTEDNVANLAVYFYYPLSKTSPYVKTSTNRIYRVRGAAELSGSNIPSSAANGSGTPTTYPPHDRKIGCIPKF